MREGLCSYALRSSITDSFAYEAVVGFFLYSLYEENENHEYYAPKKIIGKILYDRNSFDEKTFVLGFNFMVVFLRISQEGFAFVFDSQPYRNWCCD